MSKQLVEFKNDDGTSIYVEAEFEEEGVGLAGQGGVVQKAQQSFEDSINMIRPIAETVIKRLRGLASSPDQIGVEFGVKLSAKMGVIIASADTEANFKISLSWKKDS